MFMFSGSPRAVARRDGKVLVNTGLYVLDDRIFEYPLIPKEEGHEEFGLPQTLVQAAKDIDIKAVPATFWVQISEPEDLQKAEAVLNAPENNPL